MIVVGIRFKKAGKIYYFDPDNMVMERGEFHFLLLMLFEITKIL